MERKEINFGLIGLGLLVREFASTVARWCHLLDDGPIPVLAGICDRHKESWKWYTDHFPGIRIKSTDYCGTGKTSIQDRFTRRNLHQSQVTDRGIGIP
jgi:hypothetical protein